MVQWQSLSFVLWIHVLQWNSTGHLLFLVGPILLFLLALVFELHGWTGVFHQEEAVTRLGGAAHLFGLHECVLKFLASLLSSTATLQLLLFLNFLFLVHQGLNHSHRVFESLNLFFWILSLDHERTNQNARKRHHQPHYNLAHCLAVCANLEATEHP